MARNAGLPHRHGSTLRSVLGAATLCWSILVPQGLGAQEVTTAPDVTGPGAAGIGSGGLRGTAPDADGLGAPIDPTIDPDSTTGPEAPDQSDLGKPRLRPTVNAPEPSTAKERAGPPRLPPLRPYPVTSRPRGATVDTVDQTVVGPTVVGPTVAALPAPPLRHLTPDPTPFAPLGYTIGTLRLTPYVEESVGYDTNPDQVAVGVKASAFSRTEGGFDLLSLWSGNELKASMHGAYTEYFSNPDADRPDAAGTVDYRYDITRDLVVDAEGRFAVSTQRPGSPELNVAVRDRPLVSSYGASLGGSDTMGRVTFGLHGSFDRTDYENASLPDGTLVSLQDENFNDYGITGRVDYEISPVLKPFVEITADTRIHDQHVDNSGYERDSDGIAARVGTTFELTHLLTGTVSAGYEDRSYEDRRLGNLRGPLVDATLVYAVTPLTTLSLLASTSFNETTVAGSPGAESRSVSLQVSHALLRNLTITGIVGYLNTDYIGSTIIEDTISGTLKASYSLSRSVVLDASYNHQTLSSTAPQSGFSQDVFLVGLRLQH